MGSAASGGRHARHALEQAATAALVAPSIHNTQPWRWVVRPKTLELYAEPKRQLREHDPDGRMMVLSCGVALHHASVALAAEGWQCAVDRIAGELAEPLAVIRPLRHEPVDPAAMRHFQATLIRRTDRRTVTDEPVDPAVVATLVAAAQRAGARLHVLDRDAVLRLAVLVERTGEVGQDERLRAELAAWVGGDRPAGSGVPDSAIPRELPPTTVAERDFGRSGSLAAGAGHDTGAVYAVLYGDGDEPVDWLRGGEALSAVWLAATEHGLAVLPFSAPVETPYTRNELRSVLSGVGYPYLALRLGTTDPEHAGPPHTPRLPANQMITVVR